MPKRRWIQDPKTLKLIEVLPGEDFILSLHPDSGALWGDRQYVGLRATDGTDISSRTKHREYMRSNGLTTVDDFTEEWKRSTSQREAYFRGEDKERRSDVERAFYHHMKG